MYEMIKMHDSEHNCIHHSMIFNPFLPIRQQVSWIRTEPF
jgi:hypothetical protein